MFEAEEDAAPTPTEETASDEDTETPPDEWEEDPAEWEEDPADDPAVATESREADAARIALELELMNPPSSSSAWISWCRPTRCPRGSWIPPARARDPNNPTNAFQTISLKGCESTVELNAVTGEFIREVENNFGTAACPLGATAIAGDSLNTLSFTDGEGNSLGTVEFADEGLLGTTGEGSCTSFNFGGRIYSYCTCLPVDTNGDGLLEQRDPTPPCACGDPASTGLCPGDADYPN